MGVDDGGGNAECDTDGATEQTEQDGFREELGADVPSGGAKGAAQSDLGATFEDGDDHDVGDADRADQEGDGAQAKEQAVEGTLSFSLGDECGRWLADVHLVGVLRVGGSGEKVVDRRYLAVLGAKVDRGGMPVEAQVLLRCGVANQYGRVDGRGQHRWSEDADHVEPLAAGPNPLPGVYAVDPEPLSGHGAEYRNGFSGGGRVEVVALGGISPPGRGQMAGLSRIMSRGLTHSLRSAWARPNAQSPGLSGRSLDM